MTLVPCYISISSPPSRSPSHRVIFTKHNFFTPNEHIIVQIKEDKIVFRRPTLDYTGKMYKMKPTTSGWIQFCIISDIPVCNHLEFDSEESNEDVMVVYLPTSSD